MNKAKLLANYLDISEDEITNLYDDVYEYDNEEYLVVDEDEAWNYVYDDIKSLMDDMGLDAFTPDFKDWIVENCIDPDYFDDWVVEDLEQLAEEYDMEGTLVDECLSSGYIDDEDIDEDGEYIGDGDLQEIYVEGRLEDINNEAQTSVDYIADNLGWEIINKNVQNNLDSLDMDAIVQECIEWDGVAHFLARYDGEEIDLGDGYFAYRYN